MVNKTIRKPMEWEEVFASTCDSGLDVKQRTTRLKHTANKQRITRLKHRANKEDLTRDTWISLGMGNRRDFLSELVVVGTVEGRVWGMRTQGNRMVRLGGKQWERNE